MSKSFGLFRKALLGITLTMSFVGMSRAYAEENELVITADIVDDSPVIGKELSVVVEGVDDYYVNWYVGDYQKSTADTYTPTSFDYEKLIKAKIYSRKTNEVVATDSIWFSKLPVVYIDTEDGFDITTKTDKPANIKIQGNGLYQAQYDGAASVKLRGNSSMLYAQKPYKIKLDKSTDLFGMGKNKHWCLISNFIDQCGLRNMLASSIAKQLELAQMDMVYVDVVLNGRYVGYYELTEHIRIDNNRIDVFNWEDEAKNVAKAVYKANKKTLTSEDNDAIENMLVKDMSWISTDKFIYNGVNYTVSDYYIVNSDITGGYLFELSDEYDEVTKFITNNNMKVMVKSPEYLNTNTEMFNYVRKYWQDFEDAIVSPSGYNSDGKHYTELADMDSMVAYWLTNEFLGNDDAHYKSRYAYKDLNGKLVFGPVWDFDWGCGSFTTQNNGTSFYMSYGTLWKDFINDPYLLTKAEELYWDNIEYFKNIVSTGGYIDTAIEYTKEAGALNNSIYENKRIFGFERRTYETDATFFKKYMNNRLDLFDTVFGNEEYFDIVLAFGIMTESQIKECDIHPYIRTKAALPITLNNAEKDDISDKIKANGIIDNKTDLSVTVGADENVKNIEVYVNGLKLDDEKYVFDIDKEINSGSGSKYQVTFTIPVDRLTEELGDKNVISIIGKDKNDTIIYKNYATVIVEEVEPIYNVSFDTNGGTVIEAQNVKQGRNIVVPSTPVKTGYTFTGWFADKACTTKFDFTKKCNSDVVIYAGWKSNVSEKLVLNIKVTSYKLSKSKAVSKQILDASTKNLTAKSPSITLCTKKYNSSMITANVNNKNAKITFKSSNKSVATVSASGKIVAKKAGSTTITVISNDLVIKIKVTVKNPITYIKVGKKKIGKSLTLKKNSAKKLVVVKCLTNKVTFKTSNKRIVTVSKSGKLTAKKKGTATVSVKLAGQTKKIKIRVV